MQYMQGDVYAQDQLLSTINQYDQKGVGADLNLNNWDPIRGTWDSIQITQNYGQPLYPGQPGQVEAPPPPVYGEPGYFNQAPPPYVNTGLFPQPYEPFYGRINIGRGGIRRPGISINLGFKPRSNRINSRVDCCSVSDQLVLSGVLLGCSCHHCPEHIGSSTISPV